MSSEKPEERLAQLRARIREELRAGIEAVSELEAPIKSADQIEEFIAGEYKRFGARRPQLEE